MNKYNAAITQINAKILRGKPDAGKTTGPEST
jgi:hypothetical protein